MHCKSSPKNFLSVQLICCMFRKMVNPHIRLQAKLKIITPWWQLFELLIFPCFLYLQIILNHSFEISKDYGEGLCSDINKFQNRGGDNLKIIQIFISYQVCFNFLTCKSLYLNFTKTTLENYLFKKVTLTFHFPCKFELWRKS